jgi:uncharacterized protein YkwD
VTWAFGDDRDTAVAEVRGRADQAQLQRSRPRPPAETDTLHPALGPRCEPDHLVAARDHELLAYRLVLPNRPNAGAQTLALATGVLLVVGVTVAAFPEVVPVGLRIAPVAQATSPSAAAGVLPRAAQVDDPVDDPPPSEISTLHAFATAAGATASGPQAAPEPTEPSAPPAPEERAPMSVAGAEGEVIALTNQERREHGCGSLDPDARLARAARAHAEDMSENGYFSHNSRDGRRFEHRVRAAGYPRPGAENIGKGQTSAAQVVREWMASPSHRSALLTCGFTTIGVARVGTYWVQEFGK